MKFNTSVLFWKNFFAITFLSFAFSTKIDAQQSSYLLGSQNQIVVNQTFLSYDSSRVGANYKAINSLSFYINEESSVFIQSSFQASVGLHITATLKNESIVEVDTVLKVNYEGGNIYLNKHSFYLKDAYRVLAKVTSIETNVGWNVWPLLVLSNSIEGKNIFEFVCSDALVNTIEPLEVIPGNSTNDELVVTWTNLIEADEYDLEWTYIDKSAFDAGRYGSVSNPDINKIFRNNSTRVTIASNKYAIPLIFEGNGYLFYRARGVQLNEGNSRLEYNWSFAPSAIGKFEFNGHERNLNWQASTSFAEEGKRKTVVQYYDGSLRSRQVVTKDNSGDPFTVASESIYDHEGRPAIQVLPAPTIESIIKYNHSFSLTEDGEEYTSSNFDEYGTNEKREKPAPSMNNSAGASKYYSSSNPNNAVGIHRFIPDAKGFPFTEVLYTPDNTGRIERQSGVGQTHKIGSGHETVYYYGTPSQEELDALFGTEVGHFSHYQKNLVRDANGQYSVSYVDMKGRTIATALSGVPNAANLDTTSNYVGEVITERISDPESVLIKDYVMESKKSLLVPRISLHTFNYSLNSQNITIDGCNTSICYDCMYDLRITISGSSDNSSFGGKIFDTLLSNITFANADSICNNQNISFSFSKLLDEGEYLITKQLSVSSLALQKYRDSIFLAANQCKTFEDFLNEQRSLSLLDPTCIPDCQSCLISVGTFESYKTRFLELAGITENPENYESEIQDSYNKALADCKVLCEDSDAVDDLKTSMLADLTPPSGQYANPDKITKFSIFYSLINGSSTTAPAYQRVSNYKNELGQAESIYDEAANTFVSPSELSRNVFINKFKNSWAEALLPFHPEYLKLMYSNNLYKSLNEWEKRFEKVDTYQQALNAGFLNPISESTAPFLQFTTWTGTHPDMDPLALTDKAALKSAMLNFRANNQNYHIYGISTALVKCVANLADCYSSSNSSPFPSIMCAGDKDMAWRNFRSFYLELRRTIITNKINSSCPSCPTYTQLKTDGHFSHFSNPTDLLKDNGIDVTQVNSVSSAYALRDSQKSKLIANYDSTCSSYAIQWRQQLENCYTGVTLDSIINRMIRVCVNGSDEVHPFGSSSVAPSSTYTYRSFEDVLDDYPNSDINCSSYNITFPKPYDKQASLSNIKSYTYPDSCQCAQVSKIFQKYQASNMVEGSFSTFLKERYQTVIPQHELDLLLNQCVTKDVLDVCTYLPIPITIPPIFQCGNIEVCIDCDAFSIQYQNFRSRFPELVISENPLNYSDSSANKLFANFMNQKFGFNKEVEQYFQFMKECSIYSGLKPGPFDTAMVSCTELKGLKELYYKTFIQPDSGYVDLEIRTFAGGVTPPDGPVGVFDVNGNFIGNTVDGTVLEVKASYVSIWNSNPANQAIGTLTLISKGRLRLTLNPGQKAPCNGLIGLRFFQVDHQDYQFRLYLDSLTWINFGDGLVKPITYFGAIPYDDVSIDPRGYVIRDFAPEILPFTNYSVIKNFNDSILRTITVYHNEVRGFINFSSRNYLIPAWKNLRGYFPNQTIHLGLNEISDYQVLNFPGIKNWDSVQANLQLFKIITNTVDSSQSAYFPQLEKAHNLRYFKWIYNSILPNQMGLHKSTSNLSQNSPLLKVCQITGLNSKNFDLVGSYSFALLRHPGFSYLTLRQSKIDSVLNELASVNNMKNGAFAYYSIGGTVNSPGSAAAVAKLRSNGWVFMPEPYYYPPVGEIPDYDPYPYASQFSDWFNSIKGTNFRAKELSDLYLRKCGDTLNTCISIPSNHFARLCEVPDSAFMVSDNDSINNCSDKAFFHYSKAIELYKVYKDSLLNSFDEQYLEKCMNAYKYESFTVSHEVSEYHYTLYYYDQAGNLVKTVPPAGVHPNRNLTWLQSINEKRKNNLFEVPTHTLITDYRYNTLNQVVVQQTPDAGKSQFWYDRLGRLVLSQNANQKAASLTPENKLYSYTKYDILGRIMEVGQIKDFSASVPIDDQLSRNQANLETWFAERELYKGQITRTIYDQPYSLFVNTEDRLLVNQRNLRNRVSYTTLSDSSGTSAFNHGTFYTYDIMGNVDTLLQDYGVTGVFPNLMNANGNRYKKIVYDYDLVRGKVNKVSYQTGWADQFFHKYRYDSENKLKEVFTSIDGKAWEKEANYDYYQHGPLARIVLGKQQVQGIDYAYTLHGWLKGVNSTTLLPEFDMGNDGLAGNNQFVARDVIGFNLNYYDTADYNSIGQLNIFPGTMGYLQGHYRPLFNGNISSMAVNNRSLNGAGNTGGPLMLYNYRYDQLNRITGMDAFNKPNIQVNDWSGLTMLPQFKERVAYDANGNILTYERHGNKTSSLMDNLTYNYLPASNKLSYVQDAVAANTYGSGTNEVADIDNQVAGNYQYDEIGNMVKDNAEGVSNISWTVYGKIKEITKTALSNNPVEKIRYSYDAQGNRIGKEVLKNNGTSSYTWYVRDAQGNVMATYQSSGNTDASIEQFPLEVSERHIYGSSRVGIYSQRQSVDGGPADMLPVNATKFFRGMRTYELSNHLGNVLATITDKKKGIDQNTDGEIDYFDADVTSAQDYYPFGMLMPGRIGYQSQGGWVSEPRSSTNDGNALPEDLSVTTRNNNLPPEYQAGSSIVFNPGFETGSGDQFITYISERDDGSGGEGGSSLMGYRYGFNGKENDNEVMGVGNQQDYGMRIYDPRLGRFLSVDPITKTYPMLTPYQFASNTPIYAIDFDGLEMMNPRAIDAGLNFIETKAGMEAMKGNKAAQEAFSTMLSTKFKIGALQTGFGSMGAFGFFGTTATFTSLTARATTLYTTYSVAAANIGAFTIELLNPDPNGTPGLEFTQGDEIARGLKLLFKQSAVPLVKPIEKFILNTSKFDYFFGKLDYQNLEGAALDAYAKNVGRSVESLIHNQNRASGMAKVFDAWGITDTQAGFEKLSALFDAGLNAKEISSKTNEFGTTITREISLVYSSGEKKGQYAGSMLIGYLYKGGDMKSTPEITNVIPKLAQAKNP